MSVRFVQIEHVGSADIAQSSSVFDIPRVDPSLRKPGGTSVCLRFRTESGGFGNRSLVRSDACIGKVSVDVFMDGEGVSARAAFGTRGVYDEGVAVVHLAGHCARLHVDSVWTMEREE